VEQGTQSRVHSEEFYLPGPEQYADSAASSYSSSIAADKMGAPAWQAAEEAQVSRNFA
jgi:hypothetical protein